MAINTQHLVVSKNVLTKLEAILPNHDYSEQVKIETLENLLEKTKITMNDVVKSATLEKRHELVKILLDISSNNEACFPIKKKVLDGAKQLVKKDKTMTSS